MRYILGSIDNVRVNGFGIKHKADNKDVITEGNASNNTTTATGHCFYDCGIISLGGMSLLSKGW